MGTKTARFGTTALVVFTLIAPAGLAAKERRGADLVVTTLDGTLVSGELIAVKPDSLLLLAAGAADLSVPLGDIHTVRIVRRSRSRSFALIGAALGFVGCGTATYVMVDEAVYDSKAKMGLLIGALGAGAGAIIGSLAGSAAGVDSVFTVAGQPAEVLAGYWFRLAAHSRTGRPAGPATIPSVVSGPASRPGGAGGPTHGSRFRLNLAVGFPNTGGASFGGTGAFRFPEEGAPEAGPYPLALQGYSGGGSARLKLGPFGLAYDWREDWAAEVEIMPFGLGYNNIEGEMTFTSSLDGLPYRGDYYSAYSVDCLALLFGLSYRPIAPSALQRHAFEAGLAAGPALVSLKSAGEGSFLLPSARKVAVCARVRAAYDFYIVPAFSLGAFAGYCYTETSFSGLEGSMTAFFSSSAEPYTEIHRPTTTALPDLPVKASGFYWGLRVSFRI